MTLQIETPKLTIESTKDMYASPFDERVIGRTYVIAGMLAPEDADEQESVYSGIEARLSEAFGGPVTRHELNLDDRYLPAWGSTHNPSHFVTGTFEDMVYGVRLQQTGDTAVLRVYTAGNKPEEVRVTALFGAGYSAPVDLFDKVADIYATADGLCPERIVESTGELQR